MSKNQKEEIGRKFVEKGNVCVEGSEQCGTVKIVNTGATFNGAGNGSTYKDCQIDMKSDFVPSPSKSKK